MILLTINMPRGQINITKQKIRLNWRGKGNKRVSPKFKPIIWDTLKFKAHIIMNMCQNKYRFPKQGPWIILEMLQPLYQFRPLTWNHIILSLLQSQMR